MSGKEVLLVFIAGAALGISSGLLIAVGISQDYWHRVCIEHGIAEYDRVTGEWKLIEKQEGK